LRRFLVRLLTACLSGILFTAPAPAQAVPEDGYQLWLRYRPLPPAARERLAQAVTGIALLGAETPTLRAAGAELQRGLAGMLGRAAPPALLPTARDGGLVVARAGSLPASHEVQASLRGLGDEGYLVRRTRLGGGKAGANVTLIAANSDIGLLYGAFAWLRELQVTNAAAPASIALASKPRLPLRILNHWDNLDRSVERGYAGESIWNWWELPVLVDPRYTDYARANASLGINGAVLNNVNAKPEILSAPFIAKAAAIAGALRPYGIRVYLSVRWSTPLETHETRSADPLDPEVAAWWRRKADELYAAIPDFGGFLVKANSEGQPGPQDYGRSHFDGANLLARALRPDRGSVIWRAFVYSPPTGAMEVQDRARQAWDGFQPLDGKFDSNVLVQVKNGPIDFQPREPAHPLFGAMPRTRLTIEFQLTKEYLGFATHLVYLGPLFEETLRFDTRAGGRATTVARVLEGDKGGQAGGIAGVANIGSSRNWTGSTFDQANWYAFGRFAWDPGAAAVDVAREWAAQTFSPDSRVVLPVVAIMMRSREAAVNTMTPLGLHHLMGSGHHHGPAPWVDDLARSDWNPVYYHRAGLDGIGFERGAGGSNAVAQYAPELARRFADPASTPQQYLLWFHHLPWSYRMPSRRSLWEELVARYDGGVAEVEAMQAEWDRLRPLVDTARFIDVAQRLALQHVEAVWWRDACIAYFQDVSKLPLPAGARPPPKTLDQYKALRFPYAPGHG
jgi:alpha-glucuronidase